MITFDRAGDSGEKGGAAVEKIHFLKKHIVIMEHEHLEDWTMPTTSPYTRTKRCYQLTNRILSFLSFSLLFQRLHRATTLCSWEGGTVGPSCITVSVRFGVPAVCVKIARSRTFRSQ